MRTKLKQWRVRVQRAEEVWVAVEAETAAEAEAKAAALPRVVSVFGRSAVPGDYIASDPFPSVQED